ncbi:hypothetical protein ACVIRO_000197 [Rhizobium ruizarguesonis]
MHAGEDAVFTQFAGARDHFLKALRHEIGHGQRIPPGFRRMPARETAVLDRLAALGGLQRRDDRHVLAPAVGTAILEIALGRLRRAITACGVDEVDCKAHVGVGIGLVFRVRLAAGAAIVALVVIFDRRRVGRHLGDRGDLLRAGLPGICQRTEAIDDAGILAAPIVEIGGHRLIGSPRPRRFDDIGDVGVMDGLVDDMAVGLARRNAVPIRLGDRRAIILGRGFDTRIDERRARGPDFEEAGEKMNGGVAVHRREAGVTTLVGVSGLRVRRFRRRGLLGAGKRWHDRKKADEGGAQAAKA